MGKGTASVLASIAASIRPATGDASVIPRALIVGSLGAGWDLPRAIQAGYAAIRAHNRAAPKKMIKINEIMPVLQANMRLLLVRFG